MNFPFRIIVIDTHGKRCKLYSIDKEDSALNEASKFLINQRNTDSADFLRLKERVDNIRNRHGARTNFFKHEGTESDMVYALHAGAKNRGYMELNRLRWYCIRLSERCLILGNGGVKHVRKTQDDKFLKEKEYDMRWVDRVIEAAIQNRELEVDIDGIIHGDLHFTKQRIERYEIR
jgi:hypothetical protein